MSGHTSSLTHVARTVLAGAVIGLVRWPRRARRARTPSRRRCRASLFLPDSPCWKSPRARPSLRRRRHQLANRSCRRSRTSSMDRGQSSGPLGFLRDAWHQAKDPYNFAETPLGEMPRGGPPPPGAAPAPQLPPGYISLNDPGVQRASRDGFIRRRAAAAAWVLPVERAAAAARVLGAACRPGRAAGNGTDSGRASADPRH